MLGATKDFLTSFPQLRLTESYIHVASWLNCRPIQGHFTTSKEVSDYCEVSDDVHCLLYKFNKSRLDQVLANPIHAMIISTYLK